MSCLKIQNGNLLDTILEKKTYALYADKYKSRLSTAGRGGEYTLQD